MLRLLLLLLLLLLVVVVASCSPICTSIMRHIAAAASVVTAAHYALPWVQPLHSSGFAAKLPSASVMQINCIQRLPAVHCCKGDVVWWMPVLCEDN
jgi:hypothetical protein